MKNLFACFILSLVMGMCGTWAILIFTDYPTIVALRIGVILGSLSLIAGVVEYYKA